MKTFTALALEKIRLILMLKNAPTLAKNLQESVSEDDWKIIENLSKASESRINSTTLLELIRAYDAMGKAYIESLPLELAAIAICA